MTLIDSVAYHARQHGDKLACIDLESGRRLSYAALDHEVDRASGWLRSQVGEIRGERVATVARNGIGALVLHLACIRAGAIYVPFNWRLAPAELETLIRNAQPALLVHGSEFQIPPFSGQSLWVEEFERQIATAPPVYPVARPPDEVSTLLYTSGTSGTPKGVMLTENNVFWGCTNFNIGNDVTSSSVMLCDMPMYHTAGLFAVVRSALLAGATVLISGGFDPARTLARLADPELAVTHYFSVPQMAQRLWQHEGFRPQWLQGLRVYATGGAPNPRAQVERFVRAGIPMSDGFGMSETGSNFGMPVHNRELLLAKAGSCGLPYLSIEARIVDDAGRDVGDNEVGELWLRGPSITRGYWNEPQLSAAAFADGWFRTGDAAMRDPDGFYFLIDRRKDMYISGGENVYPAEVEAVLHQMEGVREAAVIGVADEKWGEVGRAYVVLSPAVPADPRSLLEHCRRHLAKFKVPASVVFTDAIPRTASGKVLKTRLREEKL